MKSTQIKSFNGEVLDIDSSKRTVVAYVSKFGNIDLDGDMMMPGCYKKSIQERGKSGADLLYHLSNHRMQPEYVLSKADFEEDNYGLKMYSTMRNTLHANDILEGYENKIWNQHSVMFQALKGQYEVKTNSEGIQYNEIRQTKFYEGSTVVLGANPETPFLGLKSLFEQTYEGDISKAFSHLNSLIKASRKGNFSDDFFPLLEMQIKLLESLIEENFVQKGIESVQDTIQPQDKNELSINDFFKSLENKFHTHK